MSKLTLATIGSRYASVAALNANFDAIEAAIENTLSLDGTTPNSLQANLDINGHSLLNVGALDVDTLSIAGVGVTTTELVAFPDAADVGFIPAGSLASTDVQAALEELDTEKSAVGHTHTGVYEPADATILKDADIGVSVQAYDAATAYTDTAQTFTATQTPFRATATATAGSSYTWTLTAGQVLELTFGAGNITTLSVSGGVAGTFYTLYLKQDGTGSRTAGWSGFKWPGGTVPTLSTGANAIDIFTFYYDGTSMCLTGKSQGLA